ncbi:hypothetical protein [Lacticaseibacillus pantheris]|uniref:hypothetical protein n=1 Tax=Lacticaseibacillus pantheris TaxID=171523 RepID=UPI00265AE1AC|nr:hypothetical protein [Lacticaseibacillus pantheris]WKF86010.1 hypothetical protein QY874_05365 [Lacticaseibacillus pantheris]
MESRIEAEGTIVNTANKHSKDGTFTNIRVQIMDSKLKGQFNLLEALHYRDITVKFESTQTELLDDQGSVGGAKHMFSKSLTVVGEITQSTQKLSKDGPLTDVTVQVVGKKLQGKRDLLEELSYGDITVQFAVLRGMEIEFTNWLAEGQTDLLGDDSNA